jgi:hypothetical protein
MTEGEEGSLERKGNGWNGIPSEDHCGFARTEQEGPRIDGDDKGKDGEEDLKGFELFAMGMISEVKDGEEDFELFAMGTIRERMERRILNFSRWGWWGGKGWRGGHLPPREPCQRRWAEIKMMLDSRRLDGRVWRGGPGKSCRTTNRIRSYSNLARQLQDSKNHAVRTGVGWEKHGRLENADLEDCTLTRQLQDRKDFALAMCKVRDLTVRPMYRAKKTAKRINQH